MKILGKIVIGFIGTLISLLLIVILAATISPRPVAKLLEILFASPKYELVENYETEYKNKVKKIGTDVSYDSKYKNGVLDIYQPNETTTKIPVIIWVHGGAFVAGDKLDHEHYMYMLSAQGYLVVNINYQLAPSAPYPTPIIQIGEAYNFILANQAKYLADMTNVVFGGDSAGAQMAAQFINIQVSDDYQQLIQETTGILPVVMDSSSIKGAILFCGPYKFADLYNQPKVMGLPNFFIQRVGWSYIGQRNWFEAAKPLEVVNFIDNSFPPVYLTDGKSFSFHEHSIELQKILQEKLGSSVQKDEYLFIPEGNMPHEYQFNVGKYQQARDNFSNVLNYLSVIK